MLYPPYQYRVILEKAALDAKLRALKEFIARSAELPDEERNRLSRQCDVMGDYSEVLGERIAAFPPPPPRHILEPVIDILRGHIESARFCVETAQAEGRSVEQYEEMAIAYEAAIKVLSAAVAGGQVTAPEAPSDGAPTEPIAHARPTFDPAIAALQVDLGIALNSGPIDRTEGNIAQADLCDSNAASYRAAIAVLSAIAAAALPGEVVNFSKIVTPSSTRNIDALLDRSL